MDKTISNAVEIEDSTQGTAKSQLSKCKTFETIQKNLAIAGISSTLANQSFPLNARILFGFLLLGLNIFDLFIFIIYDAETLVECAQSIYAICLLILIILCLQIIIFNVEKFFDFIDRSNDLANVSEYSSIEWFLRFDSENESVFFQH